MPTRIPAILTTITCRWEILIMITLQAVALYVFGELAGGANAANLPAIATIALFGVATQGLCSVLNDITDLDVDRINHFERPLPSGKVSVRDAWLVVAICFAGAVEFWFGPATIGGPEKKAECTDQRNVPVESRPTILRHAIA